VHFIDLIMYCIEAEKLRSVSGAAHSKLAADMKGYVYKDMWSGPPDYSGVYDVEEYITGIVRTDGPVITLNGAWAQNLQPIPYHERYGGFNTELAASAVDDHGNPACEIPDDVGSPGWAGFSRKVGRRSRQGNARKLNQLSRDRMGREAHGDRVQSPGDFPRDVGTGRWRSEWQLSESGRGERRRAVGSERSRWSCGGERGDEYKRGEHDHQA
jgi:hypothetical protein